VHGIKPDAPPNKKRCGASREIMVATTANPWLAESAALMKAATEPYPRLSSSNEATLRVGTPAKNENSVAALRDSPKSRAPRTQAGGTASGLNRVALVYRPKHSPIEASGIHAMKDRAKIDWQRRCDPNLESPPQSLVRLSQTAAKLRLFG
jgi:hypothetical protein